MNVWTKEMDYALAFGTALGLSASQIAAQMQPYVPYISRNSVIGRWHRTKMLVPSKRKYFQRERSMTAENPQGRAGPRWTEEQIADLIKYKKSGKTHKEIAALIGRKQSGVDMKVQELQLSIPHGPRYYWSDAEEAKLRSIVAKGGSLMDAARALKRPYAAVSTKAKNIGIKMREMSRFTPEDLATIREDYQNYVPVEAIAEKLGRSVGMIRQQTMKLGLHRDARKTWLARRFGIDALKLGDDPAEIRRQLLEKEGEVVAQAKLEHQHKISAALDEMENAIAHGTNRQIAIQAAMIAGATLHQCGLRLGVTRERIRQIVHRVKPYKARPEEQRTTCANCGVTYQPVGRAQKFCSPRCRLETQKARYTSTPVTKNCRQCGNEFTSTHGNKKYCGPACAYTAMSEKTKLASRTKTATNRAVNLAQAMEPKPPKPRPVAEIKKIDTRQPYTLRRHKYT